MTEREPLVSVLMPALNVESSILQAIESLSQQSYRRWELLVVDDGSRDATAARIADAAELDGRIRPIFGQSTQGRAARLNELVSAAAGTLVARMDADDVSYPQRLARQVAFLDAHPDVDVVGASMIIFGREGQLLGKRPAPSDHEAICRRPGVGFELFHPTWVGRTEWFRRHPYRRVAVRCEDTDVLVRAYPESTFANICEPLLGYHEDRVKLRETTTGRANYVRRGMPLLWHRSRRAVFEGLAWHGARALLDACVVLSGLGGAFSRRRLHRVTDAECAEWANVWRRVNTSSAVQARVMESQP